MKQKSKKTVYIGGCWKSICVVFFCRKNVFRDILIIVLGIFFVGLFFGFNWNLIKKIGVPNPSEGNSQEKDLSEEDFISREKEEISDIQSKTDISAWRPYQNLWYGFTLKYPNDWFDPVVKKPAAGNMWEQKIEFRMSQIGENNPFEGFDVKIYNVQKVKEFSNTDEFPKLKSDELSVNSECSNINGHLLETGDYPAEEVYVPIKDNCYNAALYFTNTRDGYIYNIFPRIKDGAGYAGDPAQEIIAHLPEFFSVISNWNLIDIQRPKSSFAKPRVVAPKPVSFDVANGRLVCAKKNDHPGKSNKGKGKHLDMECCLDPDEYPNPWCYYSPDKYGKFL